MAHSMLFRSLCVCLMIVGQSLVGKWNRNFSLQYLYNADHLFWLVSSLAEETKGSWYLASCSRTINNTKKSN